MQLIRLIKEQWANYTGGRIVRRQCKVFLLPPGRHCFLLVCHHHESSINWFLLGELLLEDSSGISSHQSKTPPCRFVCCAAPRDTERPIITLLQQINKLFEHVSALKTFFRSGAFRRINCFLHSALSALIISGAAYF